MRMLLLMSFVLFFKFKLGYCPRKPMEVPDRRDEPLTEVHKTLSSVVTIQATGKKDVDKVRQRQSF